MKLLLTSAGITNNSIEKALFDLVKKDFKNCNLVFIPTASNFVEGDKKWFIDDLINLNKLNFKSIEITDISIVNEKILKNSFEKADILFFEGGDACHLMRTIKKLNIEDYLKELLKDKVYVGASAGSVITSKEIPVEILKNIYSENLDEKKNINGLGYVDFCFLPHFNSEYFLEVREKNIKEIAEKIDKKIYALDDNSALKIVNENVEIISEGEYFSIN